MNINKQIHGFSGVAILVVIVVIASVAAISWYVMMNSNQQSKRLATTDQPLVQPAEAPKVNTDGVSRADIEKAPAEATVFSKLPTALQTVVIKEVAAQQPRCVEDGKLVDNQGQIVDAKVTYAPVGAAIISIGCDGSAAGLFAKPKGKWIFVEKTQMAFTCDGVTENPVPKKLLELTSLTQCLENNQQLVTYEQASKKRFY